MGGSSGWNDLDEDVPPPGAVQLDEEDPLPGSHDQASLLDRNRLTVSQKHGLEVGVGVVVDPVVEVPVPGRREGREPPDQVLEKAAFALVDDDPRGGVEGVDKSDSLLGAALLYGGVHVAGYVYRLNRLFGLYLNQDHHHNFCWMRLMGRRDLSRTGRFKI